MTSINVFLQSRCRLKLQTHRLKPYSTPSRSLLLPAISKFCQQQPTGSSTSPIKILKQTLDQHPAKQCRTQKPGLVSLSKDSTVVFGGVSLGFVVAVATGTMTMLMMMMVVGEEKGLALGPDQGPLMEEEFWDNVRRYALYALTVSSGAVYTIFIPIFELLKNPVSAILILAIMAGTLYLVSQVLSAMVGVTDFSYDYAQ